MMHVGKRLAKRLLGDSCGALNEPHFPFRMAFLADESQLAREFSTPRGSDLPARDAEQTTQQLLRRERAARACHNAPVEISTVSAPSRNTARNARPATANAVPWDNAAVV